MSSFFWKLHTLSIFLALLSQYLVAALNNSDGVSPFETGYSPDVVTVDLPWNESFADYEGTTLPDLQDSDVNITDTLSDLDGDSTYSLSGRSAQNFYLRLMPLGASITEGVHSTDGNGYRKWIRDQLRWKGWQVNMVGSKQNGNMADKDNEGHPGWVVTTVHDAFAASAWMKPNLVLLNVGTNDCIQNIDTGNAGSRIKVLIDDIFDKIPGVTVILSTLVPGRDFDSCSSSISQQYRDLAATYLQANTRLQLADMHSFLTLDDLYEDGIHPNDGGYKKMAAVWWDAIAKAESSIQAPAEDSGVVDTALSSPTTCSKVAGNARGPIKTQQGSGHDDGLYIHHSTSMGNLASGKVLKGLDKVVNDAIPDHMFFAQLVNGGGADRSGALDEWIRVEHQTDGTNRYWMRQNLGGGKFADHVQFDVDMNCDSGPTYYFADFNNDGLDDFFCLQSGSAVAVSLNRGGNPPKFEHIGQVVPTHDGYDASDVRIADIDGDGRADYCLIDHNGDIICSRNGGQGDQYYWQGFSTMNGLRGTVFTSKNKGDKTGVRLADLNGDFRSDWMWIGDQGDVDSYMNQRGWGTGIVPDWTHSGITHGGMATAGVRKQIKFGRIYGSGRLDYVYFQNVTDGYEMHVWQNNGGGGTKRKGDGVFYCDMRNTGSDDYVWIYQDGHSNPDEIFTNIHEPPGWGHDTKIELNVPGPRIGIHLADWNGDGKCDVLVQNKATGALTMWENRYDASTKTLSFVNVGIVTGSATCVQGWGVNIFDRGMRLADIDGDGRADVLCIEPNGRITAWLNPKAGLLNVGQVKFSEGWDRSNMRLADVENSGRADLIHLDKYTGAATVFKNLGHTPGGGGSSFSWAARGVLYSPIDRGETMNFANQGGLGRADLIHVLPVSNTAYTYFNQCGGGSGGDDGLIVDPGLPAYSSSGDDDSDDDDDDDEEYTIDDGDICDYSKTFNNLDDLNSASGGLKGDCIAVYTLETLITMLDTAYANYTSVNDGYDEEFGYYVTYIEKLVPAVLDNNFMFNTSTTTATMSIPDPGYGMDYFDCQTSKSGSTKFACSDAATTAHYLEMASYETTLTLTDKDGYTKALADAGISLDWVDFGDYQVEKEFSAPRAGRTYTYNFASFPIENSTMVVPNPKDIVTKGLGSISQLRRDMEATLLDMILGNWAGGSINDPAQAYSTLVFMLMQAVDGMAQAKALAKQEQQEEQEEEKRKKDFILLIISVVLMFVPVIGEELALATGFATLARAIALTGELGNSALAIYDTVEDPKSAIVNVLGMLVGVGAIAKATRDGKGISGIASLRKGMSADTVKGLGDVFKNNDDTLQSILKLCRL